MNPHILRMLEGFSPDAANFDTYNIFISGQGRVLIERQKRIVSYVFTSIQPANSVVGKIATT